ncbi:conserved hypothetical protein [Hyella patelloides LEGE 07179]|uniref:Glycosyl transferase n=1 Tax=Hyella patelloides LEGE 07179 TaxID=945734 RepID=A0A563VVQ8_9CYAN|nr:DUF6492 family protein [Hyella patelloides]VEP15496.1 conserved hypothetical protein [Hyella patelloides LEGE 07179]
MSQFKSCFITPSYKPDFDRCRLLAKSIDNFAVSDIHHYIVVDRKDAKLFQQLASSNRTIITVESILPWWIQKIPVIPNGWFSWKTLPLRNWVVQQVVKLEIVNHISEDVLIFVDSDVTFVRAFDLEQFFRNGKVRLFRESIFPSSLFNLDTQLQWRDSAGALLGLSSFQEVNQENPFIGYVGNLITWKRDNVLQLHQHIEKVTQKSWIKAIAECWNLSEYMLYGIFVDRVLKENSGHYWDSQKPSHDYWGTTPLEKEQLQQFFQEIPPECCAVMISSKSKTPVVQYEPLIQQMDIVS